MERIFILRIFMGHEFDRVAHISAHPSWQAAETYAQETALRMDIGDVKFDTF